MSTSSASPTRPSDADDVSSCKDTANGHSTEQTEVIVIVDETFIKKEYQNGEVSSTALR